MERPVTYETLALTVLRVGVGMLVLHHGAAKLLALDQFVPSLQRLSIPFAEVSAMSLGVLETLCGVGLILGMSTRAAAIVGLLILFVTVYSAEPPSPFAMRHSEAPILLGLATLYFAARGAGQLSMDMLRERERRGAADWGGPHAPREVAALWRAPVWGGWHGWRREALADDEPVGGDARSPTPVS